MSENHFPEQTPAALPADVADKDRPLLRLLGHLAAWWPPAAYLGLLALRPSSGLLLVKVFPLVLAVVWLGKRKGPALVNATLRYVRIQLGCLLALEVAALLLFLSFGGFWGKAAAGVAVMGAIVGHIALGFYVRARLKALA